MLDYEWGNPSNMMVNGDDPPDQDSGQNPQLYNHYTQNLNQHFINSNHNHESNYENHHQYFHYPTTHNTHLQSHYDPNSYGSYPNPDPRMGSLDPVHDPTGFMTVPKSEPAGFEYNPSRIGLNLGGRTYFSSTEDDFVNRLYHRSSMIEPGSMNVPRCQAAGCNANLTHAKHYHRRHKVCEFHSKAATVIAAGLTQRFCQQCSRFHLLTEFDNGKRSCRKRLADHNRRRRKTQQKDDQDNKLQLQMSSSSENLTSR
ncbi:hypothetical protein AgCh_034250 [Apium graveolens]